MQPYFDSMKAKVMDLFFEDYFQRLTYDEILEKFKARHPQISLTNLPRRIKELVAEQRLVSAYDQGRGRVIFHLKLLPIPEVDDKRNVESLKNSEEK
jgi:hypothetical protein